MTGQILSTTGIKKYSCKNGTLQTIEDDKKSGTWDGTPEWKKKVKSGTLLVEGDIGVQGPPNTLDRLKAGFRDHDKSHRDKVRRRWQRSLLAFSRFG